ncbi:MAG: DNA-3-methyladenine glycosylase [Candidatus Saganbacteria bacterium]|nr:DNA-3-methyladenine glycosylase [Candidatus Saganbacteria bacterium]
MKPRRLARRFFLQPTLVVAKALLGKYLVREYRGRRLAGRIVETEAYIGRRDRAAHSYGGRRTARNEVEYGPGGHVYIYMVYGMHYQLNFVTGGREAPECVLVRALEPAGGVRGETNGPGKLCRALHLDRSLYGVDLCARDSRFYLEDHGGKIKPGAIGKGPRIGIGYAGRYWSRVHWRFFLKNNRFVSR